nr:hypothetical protein [Ktedonobacteraceae bacterium]
MASSPVTSPTSLIPDSAGTNRGDVALRGRRLRLLQVLWVVLVLFDLTLLVVSLPVFYQLLQTVCTASIAVCQATESDQLTPRTLIALQHAGISIHAYALYVFTWDMLVTLAYLLVGAVIIWRRANTWMGLFVSFFLLNFGSLGVSTVHQAALSAVPSDNALVLLLANVGLLLTILAYLCLGFFFFTFPDGHLVPRWSWVLISLWIVNLVLWGAPPDLPLNINNWPPLLQSFWLFILFGGSLTTQVYRYRKVASPLQRQQIKWLIYGFVPVLLLPICFGLVGLLFPALNSSGSLLPVAAEPLFRFYYLPIPFCIGIALLRYRLWDIDVLINRTLVYGSLTALLALLYVGLIFALQSLFQGMFHQNNDVAIVVSTLVIVALFQPLRHRIQQIIDRRFYRRKYDARRIIANFSATLRGEVELTELSEQLVAVVEETMQPAHVSLWLAQPRKAAYDVEELSDAPVS